RIRAIQRRTESAGTQDSGPDDSELSSRPAVTVGGLTLNPATRQVTLDNTELVLTALEFNLLEVLMRSAGRVVTREQLSERVLERQFSPFDRSLDVHVSNLRRKLGADGASSAIKTIRGVGYQLVAG
ncbi:MAG: winged helix-turn-helix transcriptional regulator, partial [Myxococcales bacterium]|nr:winged helix-turn-helix transcriptional regulator [Myxococcales bacterium]